LRLLVESRLSSDLPEKLRRLLDPHLSELLPAPEERSGKPMLQDPDGPPPDMPVQIGEENRGEITSQEMIELVTLNQAAAMVHRTRAVPS
jgi:hypothetical protein